MWGTPAYGVFLLLPFIYCWEAFIHSQTGKNTTAMFLSAITNRIKLTKHHYLLVTKAILNEIWTSLQFDKLNCQRYK